MFTFTLSGDSTSQPMIEFNTPTSPFDAIQISLLRDFDYTMPAAYSWLPIPRPGVNRTTHPRANPGGG